MKKIVKNSAAVAALLVVTLVLAQPVHAQTLSVRADRASYVPGDSGTLFISIVNESPTQTVEIRNITVYFPWAGFVDGKWQGGNVSVNLSPFKSLTTSSGGDSIYNNPGIPFTIPGWFGGQRILFASCSDTTLRYGLYVGCILVGTNGNGLRYDATSFSILMAAATYNPPSLVSQALPIATLVVLVIATAFLFLAWTSLRRMETKK